MLSRRLHTLEHFKPAFSCAVDLVQCRRVAFSLHKTFLLVSLHLAVFTVCTYSVVVLCRVRKKSRGLAKKEQSKKKTEQREE